MKRALQLRFVKDNKDEESVKKIDTEKIYADIADAAGSVIRKVAMAALAYVAVDTARQVLVAKATNKQ